MNDRATSDDLAVSRFWRSIAEADGTDEATQAHVALPGRRDFMKWMAASLALAGAGCSRPPLEPIVPYVSGPAQQGHWPAAWATGSGQARQDPRIGP